MYKDSKGLRDSLSCLVNQNFPKDKYEIIVADNGSTDGTLNVAKNFNKKYPGLVHYVIENKIQSSYAARNRGIKLSKGKLIKK